MCLAKPSRYSPCSPELTQTPHARPWLLKHNPGSLNAMLTLHLASTFPPFSSDSQLSLDRLSRNDPAQPPLQGRLPISIQIPHPASLLGQKGSPDRRPASLQPIQMLFFEPLANSDVSGLPQPRSYSMHIFGTAEFFPIFSSFVSSPPPNTLSRGISQETVSDYRVLRTQKDISV